MDGRKILEISSDSMVNGSNSKYYEIYRDALAAPIPKELLKESAQQFFMDVKNTIYGIFGALLVTQVRKSHQYDSDFV